jgi:hypothetical protein
MFADPLPNVTINAVPYTLNRVSAGVNASQYSTADGTLLLSSQHLLGKRARRTLRFRFSKIAVDPLVPTQNAPYSMGFTFGVDVPLVGFTIADQKFMVDGCVASLNATSGLLISKLLGWES